MNAIRVNRKSAGINFSERGEAEVLIWAPYAKAVTLVNFGTGERIPLQHDGRGYWATFTSRLQPGDQYFIDLDGKAYPDPASVYQPDGVSGPSQIINLHAFGWEDHDWKNPELKDYVIYELHVGTFTPEGTFAGVASKLDYLKSLGITAIELMPVAQFSGTRNWGYDGVFPFAVQNSYGGPEALQALVNACHQRGIAVILDVVYNHLGPEGNNLEAFGPFFTEKYKTPWGKAVNFDDAGCDAVRKYFIENALMWFRDFRIDALRLDAVHAIKDFSPEHILRKIKQYTNELMWETGRTHYLIAECDLNDIRYIDSLEEKGYGMDAQWVDEFHHALRVTAGHDRMGYYEDFNGILHFAKAWRHAYVYDGQYSTHRDKTFGTDATNLPADKFVVFSQNHDQIGNRMLGERTAVLHSFELLKVLAATVLTSPFIPMVFMGEEYAEKNPFQYFVSHQNKELIEAVRTGRKHEFAAFHNGEEVPDPQAEETFKHSRLNWNLLTERQHEIMFKYYQKLIALRKQYAALSGTERNAIKIGLQEAQWCLTVHRWTQQQQQHVLLIFNFSTTSHEHSALPEGIDWKLILNSASTEWSIGQQSSEEKLITAESFRMYSNV